MNYKHKNRCKYIFKNYIECLKNDAPYRCYELLYFYDKMKCFTNL